MPIPDYQTLMLPVLQLVAMRELTNRACVESIADQFALSPEERVQLLPSGKQTLIANRVHWAATYLTKAGLLDRPKRGTLIATDRGRAIVSQNLQRIDNKFLAQFQGFQEFQSRSKEQGKPQAFNQVAESNISATVATPEEQIEIASQEMNSALRDELLARIMTAEPTFFEKVIIDLMLAMGYGASGSGQHLGKTNDGVRIPRQSCHRFQGNPGSWPLCVMSRGSAPASHTAVIDIMSDASRAAVVDQFRLDRTSGASTFLIG